MRPGRGIWDSYSQILAKVLCIELAEKAFVDTARRPSSKATNYLFVIILVFAHQHLELDLRFRSVETEATWYGWPDLQLRYVAWEVEASQNTMPRLVGQRSYACGFV